MFLFSCFLYLLQDYTEDLSALITTTKKLFDFLKRCPTQKSCTVKKMCFTLFLLQIYIMWGTCVFSVQKIILGFRSLSVLNLKRRFNSTTYVAHFVLKLNAFIVLEIISKKMFYILMPYSRDSVGINLFCFFSFLSIHIFSHRKMNYITSINYAMNKFMNFTLNIDSKIKFSLEIRIIVL